MRTILTLIACCASLTAAAQTAIVDSDTSSSEPLAGTPQHGIDSDGFVDEYGPHHRVLSGGQDARPGRPGQDSRRGRVVQLGTGMHFWDGQSWQPSVPAFHESTNNDAYVAERIQARVRLGADLNTAGSVAVRVPGMPGRVLYSTPVAIALLDPVSGTSLVIAGITNSSAVLVETNAVLYPGALRGPGVCSDILYEIDQQSFNQDILFTGRLDPSEWGFGTNCIIQIITEFYQIPVPAVTRQPVYVEADRALRPRMAVPDLIDETLTFADLVMGPGVAYAMPSLLETNGSNAMVAKELRNVEGRVLLYESVPFSLLQKSLTSLPECEPAGGEQGAVRPKPAEKGLASASIPKPHIAPDGQHSSSHVRTRARNQEEAMRSAFQTAVNSRPSVRIDYRLSLSSGTTVAQSDTTYLVSSTVAFSSLTVEPGAVFKYKYNGTACISVGSLYSKATSFRPAYFTCVDDDSVGESMQGYVAANYTGTINPNGYANPAIQMSLFTLNLSNCVFRYAQKGVQCRPAGVGDVNCTVVHSQFYKCLRGIDVTWMGSGTNSAGSVTLVVQNSLFSEVQNPFYSTVNVATVANLFNCTLDQANCLVTSTSSFYLTSMNSIYANIPGASTATFSGSYNAFYQATPVFGSSQFPLSVSPFQSVGNGHYYLSDPSGLRNAGRSSGVPASLLSALKKKTTFPPTLLTSDFTTDTTLQQAAFRDVDAVDLGWHPDPIDYCWSGLTLQNNKTLVVGRGVVVAAYGPLGLTLNSGSTLVSEGSPVEMNHFLRYNAVQEQGQPWGTSGGSVDTDLFLPLSGSQARFRFTDFSMLEGDHSRYWNLASPSTGSKVSFTDCTLRGGYLSITDNSSTIALALTNNLAHRCNLTFRTPMSVSLRNNLFFVGRQLNLQCNQAGVPWEAYDNLFDSVSLGQGSVSFPNGYNAYRGTTPLNGGSNNKTLTTCDYTAGSLGDYYYPTSGGNLSQLTDADVVTTPVQVGLAYHTTRAAAGSQETGWLDIGMHYIGVDGSNNPIDTDGDGVPDYMPPETDCDGPSGGLAVNASKRPCEDKFYIQVNNLSGTALNGGRFDLFVYFTVDSRTYLRTLKPWGPRDVLPNGGSHTFTFCATDHSITNFDCMVVYRTATGCQASPKFRIAQQQDLARLINNTTQIANPCIECGHPPSPLVIPPKRRLNCDDATGVTDCNPEPCGPWPQPLPASSSVADATSQLDNFYKSSDPAQNVDLACPKTGFKNVYAIKQWHGRWGFNSLEFDPTVQFFCGAEVGAPTCEASAAQSSPDTTKYLLIGAKAHTESVLVDPDHGINTQNSATCTRTNSVNRYSGRLTYTGTDSSTSESELGVAQGLLAMADQGRNLLLEKFSGKIQDVASPGLAVSYSGGGSAWTAHFTNPDPTIDWAATVSVDLGVGTFSFSESSSDENGYDIHTETLSLTATTLSYRRNDESHWIWHDQPAYSSSSLTNDAVLSVPYNSSDLDNDCDGLLANWNLQDDIQYPWRSDTAITTGPLVTYNERPSARPIAGFALKNVGTPENPNWQPPLDDSPAPWPSQEHRAEGSILGAPLPVHGLNGEIFSYEPYFNFYHLNWRFEDGEDENQRGHPQGYIESYGDTSPFPNATQWVDQDQARVFPAGPFWAYGSEVEAEDHYAFRFKSPYITDATGEWEQGGYGGACLIKCKWAETLTSPTPAGKDLVFKDWNFNFRDFIESYRWNGWAWYRSNYEPGCPDFAAVTPVRFTPITIPAGQPGEGYYIGPGSWWISEMHCQPLHYSYDCCQPAVYVQPNSIGQDCSSGVFIGMPPAIPDAHYGSLWVGRVDQTTSDAHACDNYVANRNNGAGNPISCDPQIDLELLWHPRAGYETFVAPLGFGFGGVAPQRLVVDLDIDSDNNDGIQPPGRSESEDGIEDDPTKPGKIIMVNGGDSDEDGIPGFADGFGWSANPTSDDVLSNDRFVPLVLQIPSELNLSDCRLLITYSASDPAQVTHNPEPPLMDLVWNPAAGNLRIWRKDGDQTRNKHSAQAATDPGDYVAPGMYTDLTKLGFSADTRTQTFYIEGIAQSDSTGDQQITAILFADGDPPRAVGTDAVRATVIGVEVVEATGPSTTTVCSTVKDSHSSPYFENVSITFLGNPHPGADGARLVGSFRIAGRIRSDLCDLFAGDQGTVGGISSGQLQDIVISLNGEPLPNPTINAFNQPKASCASSLTRPYETSTEFDFTFNEVEVSTGLNWLRLAASDKVPGVGLTGFAEYSWTVLASQNPPPPPALPAVSSLQLESADPSPYAGWTFQFLPATFLSGSEGGEMHPYYTRFKGPLDLLADLASKHPEKVAEGPDHQFYAAGSDRKPGVLILNALRSVRLFPEPSGPLDVLDEELGFFYGIGAQSVDDVKGVWQLVVLSAKLPYLRDKCIRAYLDVALGLANEEQTRIVIDVGTRAEQVSAAAKSTWNLWLAVKLSDWNTLEAAASGDWQEAYRQSETRLLLTAYMVEAAVAIHNEFQDLPPFERGKIKGRVTLEAALIILPFSKTAQLSKVEMLTRLSEVQWIKDNPQLLNILLRVVELVKGNKPVPPVIGLVPPGLPSPVAGAEIGTAAERVLGKATAKMAEGKTLRAAVVEALTEVAANAGEGPTMIRFKELQDLLLARARQSFATEEQAFAFLSDLLTYADWQTSTRDAKQILVVLEDGEEFLVVAGRAGTFRGNHILKKQFLEVLRDRYNIPVGDVNDTPVKILSWAEHQGPGESFHNRLNAWNNRIISDEGLKVIWQNPNYTEAYQVLDEYILFLRAYHEYADMIPVVRAFAKIHGIPITK